MMFKPISAYPVPHGNDHERGMTLRDYFAGQALQGLLSRNGSEPSEKQFGSKGATSIAQFFAVVAYEYADAMLEARK